MLHLPALAGGSGACEAALMGPPPTRCPAIACDETGETRGGGRCGSMAARPPVQANAAKALDGFAGETRVGPIPDETSLCRWATSDRARMPADLSPGGGSQLLGSPPSASPVRRLSSRRRGRATLVLPRPLHRHRGVVSFDHSLRRFPSILLRPATSRKDEVAGRQRTFFIVR